MQADALQLCQPALLTDCIALDLHDLTVRTETDERRFASCGDAFAVVVNAHSRKIERILCLC